MHRDILPHVIFSPAKLALSLAEGLQYMGAEVTLFTPGPVDTKVRNVIADLSYFEHELSLREDSYIDLLKKHSFTFVTLARQLQGELIAKAYKAANSGELDIVHVYTNEEETALAFASLCQKPVVFTHHDPFNFLVKYKNSMPKYAHLPWISMSYAQRKSMPADTNWAGNVYHGISESKLLPAKQPANDYIAYLGRIIQPKGVHLAISAVKEYNRRYSDAPLKLKIAGKHYAGHKKDIYWREVIEPYIDGDEIQYVGFVSGPEEKAAFLGNARALIFPSLFDEPFGLVAIEAFACGTPVVGLDSGAIPEVVSEDVGIVVRKERSEDGTIDEASISQKLADALEAVQRLDRKNCRQVYEASFTSERMCFEHMAIYKKLIQ